MTKERSQAIHERAEELLRNTTYHCDVVDIAALDSLLVEIDQEARRDCAELCRITNNVHRPDCEAAWLYTEGCNDCSSKIVNSITEE